MRGGSADGVLCAFSLTGDGPARLDWSGIRNWRPDDGPAWIHLDRADKNAADWLRNESGLPSHAVDVLLDEDPRPVAEEREGALLLVLRAANVQPGVRLDELVSLRAWTDGQRLISSRHRPIANLAPYEEGDFATHDLHDAGTLLVGLVERLVDGLEAVIDDIQEQSDRIEDAVLANPGEEVARALGEHRRELLTLHRHFAPQRDALVRLADVSPRWLDQQHSRTLRRSASLAGAVVGDLNSIRDHAGILQEELAARLSERLNRRIYVFTVIATIFIPLTFLAGMLGANVEGIPFADEPWAFAAVVGLCGVIAGAQWLLLRRLGLL